MGTRFIVTWELTGKEILISYVTDTKSFPPPVCILQEPNLLRLAAAHANRLLHVHLHYLTSFHLKLVRRKYHYVIFKVKPFLFYFVVRSSIKLENTSQDWQIFIFSFQLACTVPSQTVPFINQHRSPALSSQAGHCFL